MSDVTARLAAYAAETTNAWPLEARHGAQRAFIDTIACVLAGTKDAAANRALTAVLRWSSGGGAALLGRRERLPAPWAALINGTAAHALDYDDVLEPAAAHVSAVLVPAVLALGEERRADGPALLDAFLVGFEVMTRLGEAVNMAHYARGWHTTLTLGAPAAAAACGRLLDLDASRMTAAISAATSFAGGSKRQFGTMMKPVHAGLAAHAGVLAAALAETGLSAAQEALEGPWGFVDLFGAVEAPGFAPVLAKLGKIPAMVEYGIWAKPYPCCASTHRSIDAVLALCHDHGLRPEQVESIEAVVSEIALRNLMYDEPRNEMEARFSMNHCLALALADGAIRLSGFSVDAVERADLVALRPRVRMSLNPVLPGSMAATPGADRATVIMRLRDGRTLEKTVVYPSGHPQAPLRDEDLAAKFEDCATRSLAPVSRQAALRALQRLVHGGSAADLTRHLIP